MSGHEHGSEHRPDMTEKNLRYAIYATSTIFILELAGGLYANSLALLSDAAHMFMDVFALVLTYAAIQIAKRPSSHKVTYGYHRLEIFSALINGITLIIISVFIAREAYKKDTLAEDSIWYWPGDAFMENGKILFCNTVVGPRYAGCRVRSC